MTASPTESEIRVVAGSEDIRIARLAAFAIVLAVAEAGIPSPVPGIKPGLANIVTLLALERLGWRAAAWVSLLRVFGSALALGGVLAALAMITKTELLLIVIAAVPVIETVCVIIQQVAVRTGHKKVFIYTPIHYAFRIKGMPEKNIVRMFWLVEAVFACIGILLYLF